MVPRMIDNLRSHADTPRCQICYLGHGCMVGDLMGGGRGGGFHSVSRGASEASLFCRELVPGAGGGRFAAACAAVTHTRQHGGLARRDPQRVGKQPPTLTVGPIRIGDFLSCSKPPGLAEKANPTTENSELVFRARPVRVIPQEGTACFQASNEQIQGSFPSPEVPPHAYLSTEPELSTFIRPILRNTARSVFLYHQETQENTRPLFLNDQETQS